MHFFTHTPLVWRLNDIMYSVASSRGQRRGRRGGYCETPRLNQSLSQKTRYSSGSVHGARVIFLKEVEALVFWIRSLLPDSQLELQLDDKCLAVMQVKKLLIQID